MPLLTITGYPACGKTDWAKIIKKAFLERIEASEDSRVRKFSISLINDESLGISRTDYASARTEKAARGLLFSAVERHLSKDCIVICDGLNYIKGFRYQLSCSAKALGTPHCLVHIGCPVDICRKINSARPDGYPENVLEELLMRYEEPNPMTKWDSPCFAMTREDPANSSSIDDIWEALVNRKIARPHAATLMRPAVDTDYLYKLDQVTQDTITRVQEAQKLGIGGGTIQIDSITLCLPDESISVATLHRLRRQFMSINRNLMINDSSRIQQLFAEFLKEQWN